MVRKVIKFTSQAFIALGACKYVVIFAPALEIKSPDIANLRVFLTKVTD